RTRAEQAETRKRVLDARRRLPAARKLPGRRLWTIYTWRGALDPRPAPHRRQRPQEQVVGADRAALDRVDRPRREVEALAARLAGGASDPAPSTMSACTSAPSGRPGDRLERSERILLVRLRGSRSPGSNAPLFVI
ncbi:MAG TPA: hypothetical protein VFN05_01600, partial [Actinomycetes bacterium]|nr:hypothetical protein [Actinomycetes bacterium]